MADSPRAVRHQFEKRIARPLFRPDNIRQIRPVETRYEARAIPEAQLIGDVVPHALGRRRGERHDRRIRETVAQLREVAIVGAEVMAPFADAVRLVYRDEAHVQPRKETLKRRHADTLRRDVEHPERAVFCHLLHPGDSRCVQAAVDEARGDAVGLQTVHLVFHQRDERRHHQRQSVHRQSRELVAERLPATRGHDDHAMLPCQRIGDDLLLPRTEIVVAEVLLQQGVQTIPTAPRRSSKPPSFPRRREPRIPVSFRSLLP